MKTLIIYGHPNINKDSYSYQLVLDIMSRNDTIDLKIIPTNGKIENIIEEQEDLKKYDRIIFAFPLYWYNIPWNLKRYIDEVFEYGFAYGLNGNKLKHIEFGYICVSGAPKKSYQIGQYNQYTYYENLRSLESTIKLIGKTILTPWIMSKSDKIENKINYKDFVEKIAKQITDPEYNPHIRYQNKEK